MSWRYWHRLSVHVSPCSVVEQYPVLLGALPDPVTTGPAFLMDVLLTDGGGTFAGGAGRRFEEVACEEGAGWGVLVLGGPREATFWTCFFPLIWALSVLM